MSVANALDARSSLIEHLVTRLGNAPAMSGVGVYPGWPGDKYDQGDMVWIGEVTGTLEVPVSTGPAARHPRDDMWSVDWLFKAMGASSGDPSAMLTSATHRASTLIRVLEDLIADDPSVDDWPGVVSVELTGMDHQVGASTERTVVWARVEMSVHSRLS